MVDVDSSEQLATEDEEVGGKVVAATGRMKMGGEATHDANECVDGRSARDGGLRHWEIDKTSDDQTKLINRTEMPKQIRTNHRKRDNR